MNLISATVVWPCAQDHAVTHSRPFSYLTLIRYPQEWVANDCKRKTYTINHHRSDMSSGMLPSFNVLGEELEPCSSDPLTGWFRDGCCNTDRNDRGLHTVCCQVTTAFLEFARQQGNDLITPAPRFNFPGLKPGDRWCVCAQTWQDAAEAGVACPVDLGATHEETLQIISLELLEQFAL